MALFKIFRGSSSQLGKAPTDSNKIDTRIAKTGYCYFTTDDGKFYIDIADGNDLSNNRVCLNAHKADQWAKVINVNGLTINGTADRTNYGVCSTSAGTGDKEVACAGYVLNTGAEITVKFTSTNTVANPTLNVNSTDAKPIYYRGSAISKGYLASNRTYTFRYNGNEYELVGDINVDTNNKVSQVSISNTTNANYHLLLASSTNINTSTAAYVKKNSKLYYNPSAGLLVSPSFSGTLIGSATSAGAAEAFASAKTIKLTGDVTGTASSTGGWSIATTLKSTGVSAGVYGLASSITPAFGESFSIPYVNVDAQGRITSAATNTVKLPTIKDLTFVNNSGVVTKKYNASEEVMVKAGTNIRFSLATNVNNVPVVDISAIDTTYTASAGIKLDGTVFKHNNSITSGTASEGGSARTLAYGGAFKIPSISYDAQGHITSVSTTQLKLPASVLDAAKDYTDAAIEDLVNSAPGALDTLGELAAALGADGDFSVSVVNQIAKKADNDIEIKAGAGLTGGGSLTSSRTISPNLVNTTKLSNAALSSISEVANRIYPVSIDKNEQLAVNVPWIAYTANAGLSLNSSTFAFGHANSSIATPTFSNWGSKGLLAFGAAFTIPSIVFDAYGHITSWSTTTLSLPSQYQTRLLVNSSTSTTLSAYTHTSTNNTNTYLRLFDSNNARETIQLKGSGATSVSSSGNGIITIHTSQVDTSTFVTEAGNNDFTGTNNFTGTTGLHGIITLDSDSYGTGAPSNPNQLYFVEDNGITIPAPTSGTNGYVLTSNGSAPVWSTNIASGIKTAANQNTIYITGVASSTNTSLYYNNNVKIQNNVLMGAAWNDYAEYRICKDNFKPGQVICENGDDTLSISIERLQPGAEIVSDTFGFAIGETEDAKCPVAVSGRVLAYTYEPREEFRAGDAVCAGPNGTVSKMTREEIREYPDRIIGTVSAIPSYETWNETVKVNNRIWIKIK